MREKWKRRNFLRLLHQAHLTRMEHFPVVNECDYKQLYSFFSNFHFLTVITAALNCRPGLLLTEVLIGLTLFLNFDFCYFCGISSNIFQ